VVRLHPREAEEETGELGSFKPQRKKALSRWHVTFEEMQAAVAGVLDRLGDHRAELSRLRTERFAIVEVEPAVACGRDPESPTRTRSPKATGTVRPALRNDRPCSR
jgi:hypothetical protein